MLSNIYFCRKLDNMKTCLLSIISIVCAISVVVAQIASFRSDFTKGATGALPDGRLLTADQPERAPHFVLKEDEEFRRERTLVGRVMILKSFNTLIFNTLI